MSEENEQFHLFVFWDHDASGGAYDHAYTGTMDECMQRVESSKHGQSFHIARTTDLTVVKDGEWVYQRSPLKGHDGTYHLKWTDVEV